MRSNSPRTAPPAAAILTHRATAPRAAGAGPAGGGAGRGLRRRRANPNTATPRQPLRPLPATIVSRRGPARSVKRAEARPRRPRRYEASRAAAEANGAAGAGGGGANAGGVARAAPPGPASRLGLQVARGANHPAVAGGGRGAGPYHAGWGRGGPARFSPPPHPCLRRGATAPCGEGSVGVWELRGAWLGEASAVVGERCLRTVVRRNLIKTSEKFCSTVVSSRTRKEGVPWRVLASGIRVVTLLELMEHCSVAFV